VRLAVSIEMYDTLIVSIRTRERESERAGVRFDGSCSHNDRLASRQSRDGYLHVFDLAVSVSWSCLAAFVELRLPLAAKPSAVFPR